MIVALFTTSTGIAILAATFAILIGWAIVAAYMTRKDRVQMARRINKKHDPLWYWRETFLQDRDILFRHIRCRMLFKDFRDMYRPAFYSDGLYETRQEP